MYNRTLFPQLEAHLAEKTVLVITGMRRVGKTMALRHLLDKTPHNNKLYLDLERIEDRAIFTQKNYSEIQKDLKIKGIDFSQPAVIALDEVQLIPEVASFIKYYHDHFPVKFITSGSSSYYLRNRFTESLAGRKTIFEMYPLTFPEFLEFKGENASPVQVLRLQPYRRTLYAQYKPLYEEFIQYGGFPEVVLADTGLIGQLAQISTGAIFENAIAVQLKMMGKVNYFQTKTGQEIDFILDQKTAIEVKETPTPSDVKALRQRASQLDLSETMLIGRYPPGTDFSEFVWGGTVC
jgi:predicted AAA+ superfamily ATPase